MKKRYSQKKMSNIKFKSPKLTAKIKKKIFNTCIWTTTIEI